MNRMTSRCKNITLPQTSFAGGKDDAGRFESPPLQCTPLYLVMIKRRGWHGFAYWTLFPTVAWIKIYHWDPNNNKHDHKF